MLLRRQVLAGIATAAWLPLRAAAPEVASQPPLSYADPTAADEWVQRWIDNLKRGVTPGNKQPVGALYLGRFADRIYFVTSEIEWRPNDGQRSNIERVRVPIGFVTDFASIPRAFWSLLPPDGTYCYAAVIHDYLYWDQTRSRAQSDEILKLCMEDFRIDAATVATIYGGVRIGGDFAWNSNARRKAAGEKRILLRFPADPTVRWDDWRSKPDVF
jgi:hypothetical protein